MENDEFMQWALTNVVGQGYPNLVLYYRLDNEYFIGKEICINLENLLDQISGAENVQASGTKYTMVADNEMTLNCPIGYNFDWATGRCLSKV